MLTHVHQAWVRTVEKMLMDGWFASVFGPLDKLAWYDPNPVSIGANGFRLKLVGKLAEGIAKTLHVKPERKVWRIQNILVRQWLYRTNAILNPVLGTLLNYRKGRDIDLKLCACETTWMLNFYWKNGINIIKNDLVFSNSKIYHENK